MRKDDGQETGDNTAGVVEYESSCILFKSHAGHDVSTRSALARRSATKVQLRHMREYLSEHDRVSISGFPPWIVSTFRKIPQVQPAKSSVFQRPVFYYHCHGAKF